MVKTCFFLSFFVLFSPDRSVGVFFLGIFKPHHHRSMTLILKTATFLFHLSHVFHDFSSFFHPGDVVLKNLVLKQSALSELDLPVQTVYGHLGSLVLKIPWKNLYSAPVEAYIDRLYLLAVPNSSVRYNAEREDKATLEAKKAELERIQLAKKMELEKSK
jgi:N-terminal region of Chorein or VPS13